MDKEAFYLQEKECLKKIRFRSMTIDDVEQVLTIEKLSFTPPWSHKTFINELSNNIFAHFIVLLIEKEIKGYGGLWIIAEEAQAHIATIAIHPDFRNRGLGKSFLNKLIDLALRHSVIHLTLEVRPSNLVALHMYNEAGFIPVGIQEAFYTDPIEDAIIMWKCLS